jgi:hypothetical protein
MKGKNIKIKKEWIIKIEYWKIIGKCDKMFGMKESTSRELKKIYISRMVLLLVFISVYLLATQWRWPRKGIVHVPVWAPLSSSTTSWWGTRSSRMAARTTTMVMTSSWIVAHGLFQHGHIPHGWIRRREGRPLLVCWWLSWASAAHGFRLHKQHSHCFNSTIYNRTKEEFNQFTIRNIHFYEE